MFLCLDRRQADLPAPARLVPGAAGLRARAGGKYAGMAGLGKALSRNAVRVTTTGKVIVELHPRFPFECSAKLKTSR